MSNTPNKPSDETDRNDAGFGEKGPITADETANKSEEEKLEDAVESLSDEKG